MAGGHLSGSEICLERAVHIIRATGSVRMYVNKSRGHIASLGIYNFISLSRTLSCTDFSNDPVLIQNVS